MSSKSRKRSRAVADENRADCPFTVTMVATPSYEDHASKKRKRDGPDDDKKELVQPSPFEPRGKFKTHQTMDLAYTVEPRKRWLDMTRYNSFVLNNVKYFNEDFVYIANDATIERQKSTNRESERQGLLQSTDYWVAKILEVRAVDEHHVYARVYWMYSPDELPANTLDGKKVVSGRQPYHGQNELIASNHMDVINVVSVAMRAVVNQWVESDDEQVQDALYWRQAFDCRTSQLSSVELTCKCKTPANPDKTLVGCTNSDCEEWLHYECLAHDVLMRTYERLGTEKPHISGELDGSSAKVERDDKPATALHSTTPTDIKGEETMQPTVGVKEGENGDSVPIKQIDGITPKTTESPVPGTPAPAVEKLPRLSSGKKGRPRKATESRPYEGLFEASLKLDDGPTMWRITNLRANVSGGDRTWSERAQCLICGTKID
ncbi:ebs-bah-phd domain-containing protein [Hirsutella rhossiliensis]|uniref:Ebs-bah-phd domain-containing protein n=1 Tax=Hirsutella rhossiliensis TaxID=111463 RepID=A0A9P8SCZ0_9HYPO|nr:ebs-bah-phd domain-containing protein [Hirsutella rhossiliensis]KAH0957394.1 ebs-bah-phd domain-containing protein [Hirsutella rhossiliensis]